MIRIEETRRPIFAKRRDRARIKRRARLVCEDATAIVAVAAPALVGTLLLAVLASHWVTELLMRLPGAGAEEAPPRVMVVNVEKDSYLNLREAPNMEAKVVLELRAGRRVIVLEERDGWALVVWELLAGLKDPPTAWACMDYLIDEPTAEPKGAQQ